MTEVKSSSRPGIFRSLLAAAALALPILFALGLQPLSWPQYWGHITVGAFIALWERIPDGQLFLFTVAPETPWIHSTWLGDLLLYYAHYWGGADFALLIRNLFASLSALVLFFFLLRRNHHQTDLAIAAAMITLGLYLFLPLEPLFLALPIFALLPLFLSALFRRPRAFLPAAFLLPATALLANLHLGAAFLTALSGPLFLLGAYLLKKELSLPAKALLLSAPLGLLAFAYGPTTLPTALLPALADPALWALFLLFPAALAILESLKTGRRNDNPEARTPPIRVALYLPALLLLAAISIPLQPGIPLRQDLMLRLHPDLRTTAPLAGSLPQSMPLRCAEELRRSGRDLRLFADLEYSPFLLHHLYDPRELTPLLFHDHRRLLPEEHAQLPELLKTEPIARGIFSALQINAVVVPRADYPALIEDLRHDRRWHDLDEHLDVDHACFLLTSPR